ncbi:hypothetical protein [Streptomyces camelliae]|uniref:Calcium-binding protein n=1 Tax=Streptomyces camelliae TaxID=3004093 RepID=A0ABY7P1W1_9ACTN|nr:hypothetical protein [Streptomyces sp. HUAS 2-6]WBO64387.1 hypothetical protein O1G22_16875 [Streptomyces sp. HUAS 2-6]
MRTRTSTLRRMAGTAAVAGLVVTASAAVPAAAAQPPGSTVTRSSGTVVLSARFGVQNQVTASVSGTQLIMEDLSGIVAGPGCTQLSGTRAACGSASTVGQLTISVGDMDDTVTNNTNIRAVIDAGTGNDIIHGGGGNDTINVHDGVGGDTVTCDGGFDVVYGDPGDNIASDCEVRGVF